MTTIERLHDLLAVSSICDSGPTKKSLITRAHQIARRVPSVESEMTNEEVRQCLAQDAAAEALAVVNEDGCPIGLINRSIFLEAYARPYARELFGRRSCIAWMDKDALIVDAETPIEELVKRAVAKGAKVLKDGFITTRNGLYAGLGTGFALMESMEALEAEKSRQILQSIEYASTIQRSHLRSSQEDLGAGLTDHALVWQPRDVVGGDCYFFRRLPEGLFGAVVDCTGHGVPGAFMTLIALSFLEQRVTRETGKVDPGLVLGDLNRYIKQVLAQGKESHASGASRSDDGMDALCFLLSEGGASLRFASARLSLLLVQGGSSELQCLDGERAGIGYVDTPDEAVWSTRHLALEPHSRILLFTDGVTDQLGGPKDIALGRKRLGEWFSMVASRSAREIGEAFLPYFADWQGSQARRDDVTLLAFTSEMGQ
ncbi:PP2C family protein-serine/threonine phosphatase [Holophaga foetida]|uniref:PP2C family protein-serine/threonine phosphatase n=1 Tax=Holophaga foetida TaxID=35839 RepID=UPI000247216D|nr:SpoIIE family protein phosphatase [Holophaga foetida]